MIVPCGQCIGCRLERARQWGIRAEHEISLHERNCFITLTYDDANLPVGGSLDLRAIQLFFKRLRKRFEPLRFKMLYCGEYGEKDFRPHYHAVLFNLDFDDRKFFKRLPSGFSIDTSNILSDLWTFGWSSVGNASFESAAYVASYCLKKMTGEKACDHYLREISNGLWIHLTPEFAHMSRGIGEEWLNKFQSDVYPADMCVTREGRVGRPPRYYDKKFGELRPLTLEDIKFCRAERAEAHPEDQTPERLAVREQVQLARLSLGKRSL